MLRCRRKYDDRDDYDKSRLKRKRHDVDYETGSEGYDVTDNDDTGVEDSDGSEESDDRNDDESEDESEESDGTDRGERGSEETDDSRCTSDDNVSVVWEVCKDNDEDGGDTEDESDGSGGGYDTDDCVD